MDTHLLFVPFSLSYNISTVFISIFYKIAILDFKNHKNIKEDWILVLKVSPLSFGFWSGLLYSVVLLLTFESDENHSTKKTNQKIRL